MDLKLENLKVRMLLKTAQGMGGAPGTGPSPAASPFAGPMPGMTGGPAGGAMGAPTAGPGTPPPSGAGPGGAPMAGPSGQAGVPHPDSPAGDQTTPKGREAEVRQSLEQFRNCILDLAQKVYEIPITEDQLKDIAERMIQTFSDRINEITVDRVIDIGHDLIGGYRSPYERRRRR